MKKAAVNVCDRTPEMLEQILLWETGAALWGTGAVDYAAVNSESLARVTALIFREQGLTDLQADDFDSLTSLHTLGLDGNQLAELPEGVFNGLTSLQYLSLHNNQLTALPEGVFNGLTSLQYLSLHNNQLTAFALPEGVFDGLTSLHTLVLDGNPLALDGNQLAELPEGVFDRLTSLQTLSLGGNQLAELPEGVFDRLTSLQTLSLGDNQLAELPEGVFDRLTSLQTLVLDGNQLAELPEGVFDGLTSLHTLVLDENQLAELPEGVFDRLTSLQTLSLGSNQLAELPEGVFDRLTSLQTLSLGSNQLAELPEGAFDGLTSLESLNLCDNHLVALTPDTPLFAGVRNVYLAGQTEPPELPATRLAAAVPLLVSASDSMRQGFVRIINESDQSGCVRILAFDDGGTAANPVEIQLGANQALHFNAGDLENGNAAKGINAGIGRPVRGDWRLGIETALSVRVLSYIRTNDGFLTAMHDLLPRDAEGRLAVQFFNPAKNTGRVSGVRLVNTGANAESISIEGVDDQGESAGPAALTLAARQSRTLSASDLENGAQGLTGTLGKGAGKWRLFITAGRSVVGVSLLDSASGHLSNLSTQGVAVEGQ